MRPNNTFIQGSNILISLLHVGIAILWIVAFVVFLGGWLILAASGKINATALSLLGCTFATLILVISAWCYVFLNDIKLTI